VEQHLRIGELARRTGVSTDLLRAWERRYGLLRPVRTDGGFRLYGDDDVQRVAAMRTHLGAGVAAAEAARLARNSPGVESGHVVVDRPADALLEALVRFDEADAHAEVDRLLASLTLQSLLVDAVFPALREIGAQWERGELTVAHEHFASTLLRGRLLGLARGWGSGLGPRALLACVPGELHDLALIGFGLALRDHGWRITFLGADTPVDTLADAVRELDPDVVVLAATLRADLVPVEEPLAALARERQLVLAGAGVGDGLAARVGAHMLAGDVVEAAAETARELSPRGGGDPPSSRAAG
jgi:DNA-binding transcriptional MerR regulator